MFRNPNTKEEQLWRTFVRKLDELNRANQVLQRRYWKHTKIAEYARRYYGEAIPYYWGKPDFLDYTYRSILQITSAAIKLNNSFVFSQTGTALMHNATGHDFDIVTQEGYLDEGSIKRAKFNTVDLPGEPMTKSGELGIAFVPLIVYGAVVVIGLVTGAIAAVAITDTIQKKYDTSLQKTTLKAEQDILKDPKLFREWASYKKSIIKPIEGTIDKILGVGTGATFAKGAVAIGAIAVIGLLAFRWMGRRK